MSSLQPRRGHWLLRCPHCRCELTAAAGALACRNGHSFDIAREGYVNLLPGGRRRVAASGDSAAQLRHRAAFLDAGCLDVVAAAIAEHVDRASDAGSASRPLCVVDAGAGSGHHLAQIVARIARPCIGLGLDISKAAASYASRRWPALAFAVADVWADWPVRDAAADLVVSTFAPKNFPEAARALRPGGRLALVCPGPEHLIELRKRFALLRQHENSVRHYLDATGRLIGPPSSRRIRELVALDPAMVRSAILMGPNAHHVSPSIFDAAAEPFKVTVDVHLLFAHKPRRSS